ncbi:hypothetical protein E1292_22310 [Nonomuraea deserti]|uniref:Uncharacterized protein n=1 Tax=Nonomuraea deserti TaxID=1848322 RepID=A0A4R4VKW8_9ACTN|nr:hypothetical protein [Nonomuraea deserti]TDD02964.1 hypothetical protein E1292_22310 [Nonomuraea deserti]
MSFTEHDVTEGRRLMNLCRGGQLAIGDILAAGWAQDAAALGEFCERIGLSVSTARSGGPRRPRSLRRCAST